MIEAIQTQYSSLFFHFQQYIDNYRFLVPLGLIGLWRWSVWMGKEIIGANYRPQKKPYRANVSIVVPVYNEDPELFSRALESWKKNQPAEIIAVIDYTDKKCIEVFKQFSKSFPKAHLIVTHTPGKRPALADGIKVAKHEIVALVDSDTVWVDTTLKNGLPPFHDPRVAGVATYQSVLNPKTFAQKIFDIQLDLRYMHEYPFLAAAGDALVCLSGRTAFYRRSVILPMVPDLISETFGGKPLISGDDKCLTYLVLAAGWKVAYQSNSHVYTPGMADLNSYLKQRLRWTRNALRADMKALRNGWPIHHPALLFFQIDKVLQSFVVILSPIFFFLALAFDQYLAATIIFCWWFISRTIKIHGHLFQKPQRIMILPGYIIYSFLTGLLRIYAFFTLDNRSWITRWDKSRMPKENALGKVLPYFMTAGVVIVFTWAVYSYKQHTYFIPLAEKQKLISNALPQIGSNNQLAQKNTAILGATTEQAKQLLVQRYETKSGETLETVAKKFGIDINNLHYANIAKLPSFGAITPGTILSIPGKDITFDPIINSHYGTAPEASTLNVYYDENSNSLVVTGRGKRVTLKDIQNKGGKNYLEEIAPKIWLAKASIFIYHGATLTLSSDEVDWLKLESNPKHYSTLRSLSGDISIDGVKITSWDSQKNDYDTNISDGRSFIMVKDNARMDIYNSELAYLGYPTSPELSVSPYGVSWKLSKQKLKSVLITGEVISSTFHHNYFGAYTYGATGMVWKGNKFYENTRYGLDPHDDSNGFLVEYNKSYNNGTQGIIFSKRCMYNIIRNNEAYDNGSHGIMLHEQSNDNIVENNILRNNVSGISLWRSSNNLVKNNRIINNRHGIRVNMNANNNTLEKNTVANNSQYGFYLYDGADNNLIQNNEVNSNKIALYIKSNSNQIVNNKLTDNDIGLYFLATAADNSASGNRIRQSAVYAIYTKVERGLANVLGVNTLNRNFKDIEGQEIN